MNCNFTRVRLHCRKGSYQSIRQGAWFGETSPLGSKWFYQIKVWNSKVHIILQCSILAVFWDMSTSVQNRDPSNFFVGKKHNCRICQSAVGSPTFPMRKSEITKIPPHMEKHRNACKSGFYGLERILLRKLAVLKLTVRGTMVRYAVCNTWCYCLGSHTVP